MAGVARERPGLQLVMTGCPFDLPERLRPLLDEHSLHDAVRHIGYVTRAEVAGLYAAARMLVRACAVEVRGQAVAAALARSRRMTCQVA